MSDSIKVAIKVRPLIKREKDDNLPIQWEVQGNHIYSIDPETKRRGDHSHVFDHIFDMNTNNTHVYEGVVRPIVESAVNGFNGTIFAYGQTSSGKTYTMMGTKEEPGVIPLAVENMFDAIANTTGREFLLRVSYLEIYNEKINDLLHENGTDLKIKEDPRNGQVNVECKEEVTNSPQNVLSHMKKGDKRRRVGETNMNERSSRSHTIFRITIESRAADSDNADGAVQVSQLNLVDLAGSERARQTGATGDRFKEGRHINLSLSSLGLVIMQLSESQEYVNFRDSKLTRILQTSLGGNAMTTIICAVTPAAFDETQCTLAFASRAKSVKNKPQLNEVMSDEVLLKRYSKQIAKLSAELEKSKQTSQCAKVEEMQSKLQEKDRHIQLIEGRMELLKTRIVSGANSVENVDFKNKSRRRRTWGGPSIPGLLNHSLPTIQEGAATEMTHGELKKAQIKRRQSIMQTPVNDIVKEEFQTAIEDFELELIESEQISEMGRFSTDSNDLEDNYYISKRKTGGNRVKFEDDVSVFQLSYTDSYAGSPEKSEPSTPPRRHEEQDSGTPKEVLRERISHLIDEYKALQEFTTLEKQLYATERVDVKDPDNMEAIVNHMKKSVTDSEMLCIETNKKYSELQDKYCELELKYEATLQEQEILKKQIDKLSGMEDSLKLIEIEKNQMKADMQIKLRRLKKLEEERNDYQFQIELLESKHKTREKELETSLQIAWTDYTDTGDKEKFSNIVHLQSLVDKLTKEVEVLRTISEDSKQPLDHQLITENKLMMQKVEEQNVLLQSTKNENIKLMEELKVLKKRLDHPPDLNKNIDSGGNENLDSKSTSIISNSCKEVIRDDIDKHETTVLPESLEISNEIEMEQKYPENNTTNGSKHSELKTELSTIEAQCVNNEDQQLNGSITPILNVEPCQTDNMPLSNVQSASDQFSLKDLQKQINEKSAIILELKDLLRIASEDNSNVKSNFQSFQAKYEEQKLEINNLRARVAELLNAELKTTNEYKDLVSKLNEMAIDKEAVVDENSKLKLKMSINSNQLKDNESLIDALKIDMDQVQLKLEEKNSEVLHIKAKFEKLQNIRNEVEFCIQEPTTDNKSVRISSLEKELEFNNNEIEKYKLEMLNLNEIILKKSDEIQMLNSMVSELNQANEHLRLKFDSLHEELNKKTAIVMNFHNGTKTIVPAPDATQNSIALSAENSCAIGIEPLNKHLSETTETGQFDSMNLDTDTDTDNTISLTVNNGFNNDESITVNKDLIESSAQIKELQSSLIIDTGKESIDVLKMELESLRIENESLLKENALLKSRTETLLAQIEEVKIEKYLEEDLRSGKNSLEKELAKEESKLCKLQNDIYKLKDQIIGMQSEKILYEGEKCAMQKIINENKVVIEQIPKLEGNIKDLELINSELERTILELRTSLNTKSLELESIGVHKYESEIQNLKSYLENLEHFNKKIQDENEDLKNQLRNQSLSLENDLDDLRQRITEQEKVTHSQEEDKTYLRKRIAELSQVKSEEIATNTECGEEKLSQDTKECSSIFVNASYFDEMDMSLSQDLTLQESASEVSFYEEDKQSNDVNMLKKRILELETMNKEFHRKFTAGEDDLSSNEIINRLHELMNVKTLLEDENLRITTELQLKIQESDEIKNDVQGLRLGIEKLQQTIHLLTTENMEMSSKLTVEKDRAKEAEAAYQGQVEDLYQRISKITEEKVNLESELKICQEQLDTLRANTPTGTEDEAREKIERYQTKIDSLTTENIELSTILMDTIKELDKIKESKALLYDHECSYKDEVQGLKEKVDELNQENIELSNNVMEKLEESESLKHAYELLENKLAVSVKNQLSTSVNTTQNEIVELRAQNSQLKSENIDLKAKVTTLSIENTKFSDNLLETMTALDNSRLCHDQTSVSDKLLDKSHHVSRNSDNFSALEGNQVTDDVQTLINKLEGYQLQINHLTRLNKKLSELKLSSCPQCVHLKELNDSRRTLKLEVRSLNHKLEDLQKKFNQKCADTEVLRNKASEELNISVMSDMMLNGSVSESMNVSLVEEKVQALNNELATLKQSHEKLSSLYKTKCSEVEKLNESNVMDECLAEVESDLPTSKDSKARIERVQGNVDKLSEEIRNLKKRNAIHSESLNKFMTDKLRLQMEIDTLKVSKDDLNTKLKNSEMQIKVANEKVNILESEVADLNKLVESLRIIEREAKSDKLNFEVEIEFLKTERITHQKALEELKISLKSEMDNNATLQKDLVTLRKEIEELRNRSDSVPETPEAEHASVSTKIEASDTVRQAANLEEMKNNIEDLKQNLAKLTEENILLLDQIEAMRQSSIIPEKELLSEHGNLKSEIETAKAYITKEIRSLKPGLEYSNLSNKTVEELLIEFLNIIMMKEQEIIKTVQDRFEREKQALEDAKRQSVDAERRVTTWAKELETDIEKLQTDLSQQEKDNTKLKREIERLENDLKESEYEKQLLKEKMEVLESDFNGLQAELTKQSEVDNKQGREVNAMQERDRLALVSAKNREVELQNSIKSLKDEHNRKVEELTFALEHHKTKNLEMKSNFEGLEANEKQLKSIIDLKSMDLAKLQQRTLALEAENLQMSETCNHLNEENRNKIQHIEEITNLLKIKCDKLSEYKTNLESIIPEYEILKEQIKERKQYAERYKNEYEGFRGKAERELNLISDKLSHEQIKTSSLSEQLMDLNNKNKVLQSELQEIKAKCEELENANDKLVKKVRNSTSNSRVEAQIEDLKDQNAMLKKNVEGASNRITELQESKNLVTRDLISLQGKYEMLIGEKKELEKIVESNKVQLNSLNFQLKGLNEKLETQIQEKNKIALELESTKLWVSRKEKEVTIAQQEIERLRQENAELNEESEDLAKEIQDRILTIEKLRIELFEQKGDSEHVSNNIGDKVQDSKKEDKKIKLINDTTEIEILIGQNKELHEKVETMNKTIDFLRKENAELKIKVTELEVKLESRSRGSSRSSSPLFENNRRKQRRSDLYNQSRPLEDTSLLSTSTSQCRCTLLSQKVRELELEIVSRNGKIATLEMQIQSENFPYQKKCKELEENLWAFKNKNVVLKEDIKRLQRAISSTSISECEVCRRRQTNKRDQSTQCLPDHKTFLSGTSSGIVDDFAKINKLEKEKALMRDLCRSRTRQIKELQQQISDYEMLLSDKSKIDITVPIEESRKNISNDNIKSSTLRDKTQIFGENNKRAMKENLSSNILDNASVISTNRTRSIWNHYP